MVIYPSPSSSSDKSLASHLSLYLSVFLCLCLCLSLSVSSLSTPPPPFSPSLPINPSFHFQPSHTSLCLFLHNFLLPHVRKPSPPRSLINLERQSSAHARTSQENVGHATGRMESYPKTETICPGIWWLKFVSKIEFSDTYPLFRDHSLKINDFN